MDERQEATSTADDDDDDRIQDYSHVTPGYRRALWTVVLLNVGYGLAEIVAGLLSGSQALMADSLDFLGDGTITLMGLIAIGWSLAWRAGGPSPGTVPRRPRRWRAGMLGLSRVRAVPA